MKIARLLLVFALTGTAASVALADSTDPKVFTSGCGGTGQTACDPEFLTSTNPTEIPGGINFTFDSTGSTASVDIVNWTGGNVGQFILDLAPTDSNNDPLTYSCGSNTANGAFNCTQLGLDSFLFDGGTLCSLPLPDNPTDAATAYSWLTSPPAPCQYGEIFTLAATDGDPNLANASVSATIFAPEPSSALFLMIGLGGAALLLRKRSLGLA